MWMLVLLLSLGVNQGYTIEVYETSEECLREGLRIQTEMRAYYGAKGEDPASIQLVCRPSKTA